MREAVEGKLKSCQDSIATLNQEYQQAVSRVRDLEVAIHAHRGAADILQQLLRECPEDQGDESPE